MLVICTKCQGKNVHIVIPENNSIDVPKPRTMDQMVGPQMQTLEYRMTTWKCDDCGYTVSG